jgi:sugar-specific transcriptional regulator TrmB
MKTGDLVDALQDAGFSQYQADAYATLLELGSTSATELADASRVPTARIYDVLRDLEAKGYIETYEQESLHARIRDPELVLESLHSQADRLSSAAEEVESRWEQPAVEANRVSIVKRFDTVFEHARALISEAENEVLVSATPEQFRDLHPDLVDAIERNVIVKVSIHTDPDGPGADLPTEPELEGAVTEARHRTLPTPFVVLVDRTDACFAPHVHSLNQYGVLVDDYTLTYVFHWFFTTSLWEVWDVLYSARDDDPPRDYADFRRCVRDVKPVIESGASVRVTVRGFDIETGNPVTFAGRVVDVLYDGDGSSDGSPPLSQLAGHVSMFVETDDGTFSVGGWGAALEDVEATRVTIESIEPTTDAS